MRKVFLIVFLIISGLFFITQACKEDDLPEVTGNNKIELTITEDSTSYVFAEITCALNQQPNFTIEQHGFCWDTIASVTTEKQTNNFGPLTSQTFQKNIESLLPNKTYYVKTYIQNGDVVIYSNELTIYTLDARPVVATNEVTNIKANRAESGGIVTAYEALFPITQRGVCWAKTTNPTIADSLTINGTGNGSFVSEMQNLDIGINYYVRAYAINSEGINYGEEKSFSTLDGVPDLTTDSIKNIAATSATFYGNIIENDGLEILEKGFCWNTSTNPTVENNFQVVAGNTLGSFLYEANSLLVNTTYYVKSYLKNSEGIFYGNEINFTTEDGLPMITTTSISNVTATTAVSGGNVTDDGGFALTVRGVCWSTNPNPTIADAHTTDGSGTGSFVSSIAGLIEWTTYYVRAYAINSNGTAYGNEVNLTTLGTSVTDYDGNVYGIVQIGNQIWMAENLKSTHYDDGTPIPLVTDNTVWSMISYTAKAMCYYDNSSTNADTYGALYTWAAAMNGVASSSANPSGVQGVCPDGWHLPSDEEWKELEISQGMSQADADNNNPRGTNEGSKLAGNAGLWTDGALENDVVFGLSGFESLPAGIRNSDGIFHYLSTEATFWSATEFDDSYSWFRMLYNDNTQVNRNYFPNKIGISVRCIKD
jgi:uncharacterized protein (TIGR02145 family)